jgi:hypothetical protein
MPTQCDLRERRRAMNAAETMCNAQTKSRVTATRSQVRLVGPGERDSVGSWHADRTSEQSKQCAW